MKLHELMKEYGVNLIYIKDNLPEELKEIIPKGPNSIVDEKIIEWAKEVLISKEKVQESRRLSKQIDNSFMLESNLKNYNNIIANKEIKLDTVQNSTNDLLNKSDLEIIDDIKKLLEDPSKVNKIKISIGDMKNKLILSELFNKYSIGIIDTRWRTTSSHFKTISTMFGKIMRDDNMKGKILAYNGNELLYVFII